MQNRAPQEDPRPPESFVRFEQMVKRLLTVSKKELDDRLATDRAKRRRSRGDPSAGGKG